MIGRRGFTLVELAFAMVLASLISGSLLYFFQNQSKKAKWTQDHNESIALLNVLAEDIRRELQGVQPYSGKAGIQEISQEHSGAKKDNYNFQYLNDVPSGYNKNPDSQRLLQETIIEEAPRLMPYTNAIAKYSNLKSVKSGLSNDFILNGRDGPVLYRFKPDLIGKRKTPSLMKYFLSSEGKVLEEESFGMQNLKAEVIEVQINPVFSIPVWKTDGQPDEFSFKELHFQVSIKAQDVKNKGKIHSISFPAYLPRLTRNLNFRTRI